MSDHHRPDDIEASLDEAFSRRTAALSVTPPTIDDLVERGQQRTRRTLAMATVAVVAFGALGITALAMRTDDAPAMDALPDPAYPTTTALSPAGPWTCSGPLGTSPDGSVSYFETCDRSGDVDLGTVPETTIECEYPGASTVDEVAATAGADSVPATVIDATTTIPPCFDPAVAAEATTTTSIDGQFVDPGCSISGCAGQYVVEEGDYPLQVAEMFCVSIDELVAYNGWTDAGDFPFPGGLVEIPPVDDGCPASATSTTTSIMPD